MTRVLILVVAVTAGACAESPGTAPISTPALIVGGGFQGHFDGTISVAAVDSVAGSAISGAHVRVNGIDVGETNIEGRLTIEAESSDDIEVGAAGYYTTTYLGTEASAVTVALPPLPGAQVHVTGVVSGYADFEVPVGTTMRTRIGNSVAQARVTISPPETICQGAGPCEFESMAWPGQPTRWFAQVEAVDDGGTPDDPDDDTVTPMSFALSEEFVARADEALQGVVVERMSESSLFELQVQVPALGPGIDRIVGVPGVGEHSRVMLFGGSAAHHSFTLPALDGELQGGRLWGLVIATDSDGGRSASVERAPIGSVVESISPPAPMPTPTVTAGVGEIHLDTSAHDVVEVWEHESERLTVVFDSRSRVEATAPADVTFYSGPTSSDGVELASLRAGFTAWASVTLPAQR